MRTVINTLDDARAELPRLMQWVADNSELANTGELPDLAMAPDATHAALMSGVSIMEIVLNAVSVPAFYNPELRRLTITPGIDTGVLLHETVHHMQTTNNVLHITGDHTPDELQAYSLQKLYLQQYPDHGGKYNQLDQRIAELTAGTQPSYIA
jgi:hypothetical protein